MVGDAGDKPITHRRHFYLFPSSNRKLSHASIMQDLGSLRAARRGTGPLLTPVSRAVECAGPGSMALSWDVRAMILRIAPSFFKDMDDMFKENVLLRFVIRIECNSQHALKAQWQALSKELNE